MSKIVELFYTPIERIGIKKHKHTQDELDYLEKFNNYEQCEIFKEEADFNINLSYKKIKIAKFVIVFSIVLFFLLSFINIINWITILIPLILTILSIIFILRCKVKIDVFRIEKNIFCAAKETFIKKTFG